jgi:hypothetical protein
VNNPTLGDFCDTMIGRADIKESKKDSATAATVGDWAIQCGEAHKKTCRPMFMGRLVLLVGFGCPMWTKAGGTELTGTPFIGINLHKSEEQWQNISRS